MRRAARWDGVAPLFRSGTHGDAPPLDELRELVAYVRGARRRTGTAAPFDIVVGGVSPADTAAAEELIASLAEAGVTWWDERQRLTGETLTGSRRRSGGSSRGRRCCSRRLRWRLTVNAQTLGYPCAFAASRPQRPHQRWSSDADGSQRNAHAMCVDTAATPIERCNRVWRGTSTAYPATQAAHTARALRVTPWISAVLSS